MHIDNYIVTDQTAKFLDVYARKILNSCIPQINCNELRLNYNQNLPTQVSLPSPDKPGKHVQEYDPGMLSHVAFSWHVFGSLHSSISKNVRVTALKY